MHILHYRVEFLTPAFLGNAEQSGQWRTPPFKALLRQWWRVVWAAEHGFPTDVEIMRREEGRLFGNAWLDGDFRKSAVRLRLDKWPGGLETKARWGRQEVGHQSKVCHPEVKQPVGPLLYLGYGPLDAKKGAGGYATVLKRNAAIQAGESAVLSIAVPASAAGDLRAALGLLDAYGAVGGRSRNGWGSLAVDPCNGTEALDARLPATGDGDPGAANCDQCIRPWLEALELDWPHALGADDSGPLVWRTRKSYERWKDLMRDLAILKIGLRTMFVFPKATPPHRKPLPRHWLSYPITRHRTRAWDRNARLPNSLRLKVRRDPDDPKRLRGLVFHVPCLPPAGFYPDTGAIQGVWRTTHQLLDELAYPPKRRRYAMIDSEQIKAALKSSLDRLALERVPE